MTTVARPPAVASDGVSPTASGPRRRYRLLREHLIAWAFAAPVAVYLVLFFAYPLYRNVDLSLRDYTVMSFVHGGAKFIGLKNYSTAWSDPVFPEALWHTAFFVGTSLLFQYSIGLALAIFFNQNFRLSGTLRALLLVPWLLPLIVSATVWAWMLNSESGVVNSLLRTFGGHDVHWLTSNPQSLMSVTIANIWIGIPFNLVLLYSGLQNINADVYEAASLDGASAWQRFRYVTIPLLRPVSAITLLLGFIYTLKVFDIIWIMTRGGPANSSTTLATWSYQLSFGNLLPQFGPGSAVGNMLIVVAFLAGVVYVRFEGRTRV